MPKTTYLTTPLYYVNAAPHIGHSYTTIAADALARYHRLRGEPVFLLTGTDEHGQKIAQAAAKAGKEPQAFTDEVSERFRSLWGRLSIRFDDYIRTTQPRHVQAVQQIVQRLKDTNQLTHSAYEGWYCTPDETFWTEAEAKKAGARPGNSEGRAGGDPVCPTCQRPVEFVREEGWHLPLEPHRAWLRGYVAAHPDWIQPAARYNELKSLLEQPLPESLSITRPKSRISWGIPVPFAPDQVVYVWIDALLNYITVAGYPGDPKRFAGLWPADIHFIGKDILRHHALYWPIMLHALGLPDDQMPRRIIAHGHWKVGEQKMSKSLGNIIDPHVVMDQLLKGQPNGADIYRYFLLREIPFGQDGSFSEDALMKRFAADLANDLGNLVNRTCSMIDRYRGGKIPAPAASDPLNAAAVHREVEAAMAGAEFSAALGAIMGLVTKANQFVETAAPWKLDKQPEAAAQLDQVLAALADALRIAAILLAPFLPSVAGEIWRQLGCTGEMRFADAARWGLLPAWQALGPHPILFPRAEAKG